MFTSAQHDGAGFNKTVIQNKNATMLYAMHLPFCMQLLLFSLTEINTMSDGSVKNDLTDCFI